MNAPKLNKKQREFLRRLRDIEIRPFATLNAYDFSNTAKLTLMLLDPQGWLFDDYVEGIKNYLQELDNENK